MQSHVADLQRVLSRLLEAGFTLRGSKCSFGQPSISHLGFQYSYEGVTPTAQKTQSVIDWPTPESTKEVRSFLGFVNFYRRFIPRFADIAAPLTYLTGNNATFRWDAEQQTAFKQLQQAMISPPLLDYPKLNDHFVVADALSRCPVNLVTLSPPVSKADLSEAQKTDPVLKAVMDHLLLTDMPPTSGKWRTFPHRRFKQLWQQLCVYDSLLRRKVKTPTLTETKHLIIVPQSFQKQFLSIAHEASGHQGSDRTFSILSNSAYWVGMARDVNNHCSQCHKYQISKAPASKPVPL